MARVALAPAARSTVRFTLTTDDLTFLGAALEPRLEPGLFELFVGHSADRKALLSAQVRVVDQDSADGSDHPR